MNILIFLLKLLVKIIKYLPKPIIIFITRIKRHESKYRKIKSITAYLR